VIEGEIRCVCLRVQINDLNLVMEKGDVVYLPATRVMASQDLMRLRAGVDVRFVRRCREERAPGPPVDVIRPEPTPIFWQPPLPPPVEAKIDLDVLAEKVAARMPRVDTGTLQQLIQMITGGSSLRVSSEPQFIPEMGALPAADVVVSEQKAEGGTVEIAVKALKKARKTGKKTEG